MARPPSDSIDLESEMSLGRIFSRSFALVRRSYVQVLPMFLGVGIIASIFSTLIESKAPKPITNITGLSQTQVLSAAKTDFTYVGVDALSYFVVFCLLYFAVGYGIWKMNEQLKRAPAESTQTIFSSGATTPELVSASKLNYASLVLTAVIATIIIFAGSILIFIGALILATVLYLTLAACAIEGKSPTAALGRSRQLVSGKWLKTFALMVAILFPIVIVASFVGTIAGFFFSGGEATVVSNVVWNIMLALLYPLVSASMLLLYYSNRAARNLQYNPRPPPSPYDSMRPQPMGPPSSYSSAPNSSRRFCPSCGAHVEADERFCHNCGTALTTQT